MRGETLAPSLLSAHTRVQRLLLSCCNCCYLYKAADICLLPPCAASLHFCPSFCIVSCLRKVLFYEIPFPVFRLMKIKSLLLNILCERYRYSCLCSPSPRLPLVSCVSHLMLQCLDSAKAFGNKPVGHEHSACAFILTQLCKYLA